MRAFRHFIVGIDFSRASRQALKEAIDMARMEDASLSIVHVLDGDVYSGEESLLSAFFDELASQTRLLNLTHKLRAFVDEFSTADLTLRLAILTGCPHERLGWMARETQADLVILGESRKDQASPPGSSAPCVALGLQGHTPIKVVPCEPHSHEDDLGECA